MDLTAETTKPKYGDADFMDTSYQNGGLNGEPDLGSDEEAEDEVSKIFMAAIQHIMDLEKRKASIDDEESKIKAILKEKHDADRNEIKVSGELLAEKESLRDKLISLKETREKLIDELHLFKTIDDEMQGFNRVNEHFNDNLRKHLALIEEKQAKIYTLKPVITGVHVGSECNFSQDERGLLNSGLIQALTGNLGRLDMELKKTCEENNIKTTEEWIKLQGDERAAKKRIASLKLKLSELTRAKNKKAGKKVSLPDDEEEASRGGRGKRTLSKGDEDETEYKCEGCHAGFSEHFKFAYHSFRGCSKLEDLMHDMGKDVSVDCPECSSECMSYLGYQDHMRDEHGIEGENKSASAKSSQESKPTNRGPGRKRTRY